ncbi:hypothetical protein BWQ92_14855 [Arthrobacter sp. QXT-31]|nr:hypothetical protein BWQ92_14855 [Arthrobacter sp. QXT-31]
MRQAWVFVPFLGQQGAAPSRVADCRMLKTIKAIISAQCVRREGYWPLHDNEFSVVMPQWKCQFHCAGEGFVGR